MWVLSTLPAAFCYALVSSQTVDLLIRLNFGYRIVVRALPLVFGLSISIVILGVLQYLVLRRFIDRSHGWLVATAAVAAIAALVAVILAPLRPASIVDASDVVVVFGVPIAQAVCFRRRKLLAMLWPLASWLALTFGLVGAAFLGVSRRGDPVSLEVIDALIRALLLGIGFSAGYGTITGLFLRFMLHRPHTQSASSSVVAQVEA